MYQNQFTCEWGMGRRALNILTPASEPSNLRIGAGESVSKVLKSCSKISLFAQFYVVQCEY